jgi:8-oxo-dGTP pyrophosphatase MutT (NUDIX family)
MIDRVRAILITPAGRMLAIKRVKPGLEPYWVLPGGHVDADDASLEDALQRELREEIAGQATIASLLYVLPGAQDRQYFYLGHIERWAFDERSGPEFRESGRGQYLLQELPVTRSALENAAIKPAEIANYLARHADDDLFSLPDLRVTLAGGPVRGSG